MTQAQAKREICGLVADVLEGHMDLGAEYIYQEVESDANLAPADIARRKLALQQLINELIGRSQK